MDTARRRAGHALVRSWRELILLAAIAFTLYSVVKVKEVQDREAEGRMLRSLVVCTAVGAVIDAGRAALLSGAAISPREFEQALEGLGLPSRAERQRRADVAAQLYARSIAEKVQAATGLHNVVRPDGTLACGRLPGLGDQ